jgi:hypothetical protein
MYCTLSLLFPYPAPLLLSIKATAQNFSSNFVLSILYFCIFTHPNTHIYNKNQAKIDRAFENLKGALLPLFHVSRGMTPTMPMEK